MVTLSIFAVLCFTIQFQWNVIFKPVLKYVQQQGRYTNIAAKCYSEIPQQHRHMVKSFQLSFTEDYIQPEIFGWCDLPGLMPAS